MNIIMMAFGSRGDIQPFLGLAVVLRERGHSVTLAAPSDFEAQIKAYGIAYIRMPVSVLGVLEKDSADGITRKGITPATVIAFWREVIPELKRGFLTAMQLVAEAAQNADLLIAHGFLIPLAYTLHQRLKIPVVLGIAAPVVSTKQFPSPMFPPISFGQGLYNPLSYQMLVRLAISYMIEPMNTYRKSVGLPTLSTGKIIQIFFRGEFPTFMHYSPHVMPPPSDWPANMHVVGAWPLPALPDWTPPESLTTFLAQGEPPVFFGFGSMVFPDPVKIGQTISEALRLANLRGVLQAGWAGLAHEDEHLITVGDTPHDWLFPRMTAFVHHGGSGTTHSALSSGKPALIVPFMADQPFWGRRLAELGVGVPPIRPNQLTPERLADALRTLTQDTAMRQRASELGALLRAENGLAATCEFVEQYVTKP